MGTEITVHFEIKVFGKWEHYSSPSITRNYEMFGWLARVRYPELQHIQVKGLPEDISISTQIGWNRIEVNAYEPSWLTAEEIVKWVDKFPEQLDYFTSLKSELGRLYGNSYSGWVKYPEDYPQEIEDLRMVFWFS